MPQLQDSRFSQDDINAISSSPLEPSVGALRQSLRKGSDAGQIEASQDSAPPLEADLRDAISSLILALQGHSVAKKIKSASLRRPLNRELASVYSRLDSDEFDLKLFRPLTSLIVDKAQDTEIWKAVIDLIEKVLRTTPDRDIPPSYFCTPMLRSSGSHFGRQIREEVEPLLIEELDRCTFEDVPEFYTKYFENRPWTEHAADVYRRFKDEDGLQGFPATWDEKSVWNWWNAFQERYIQDLEQPTGIYHHTKSKGQTTGGTGERQIDILLKTRIAQTKEKHHFEDFRVVGELTTSSKSSSWKRKFLQLAVYMRDIFSTQPTRLFVHGFLLFGTNMQLWVFDRSGAVGSEVFNILEEPERFIRIICGYALMTSEEHGLDNVIKRGGNKPTVTVLRPSGEEVILELEDRPFVSQDAIVCRGTCCYRTADQKHVVKISWRPAQAVPEADHLRMAVGLKGVAQLFGCRETAEVAILRDGLSFGSPKILKKTFDQQQNGAANLSFNSQSAGLIESINLSGPFKRKNGFEASHVSKKSRSNSQVSRHEATEASVSTDGYAFRNRKQTCIAVSPSGRSLTECKSMRQLLLAFYHAIEGHRNLYEKLGLLHRDVSLYNIILPPSKNNESQEDKSSEKDKEASEDDDLSAGLLIDLDLTVKVVEDGENDRSRAKNITGTTQFMAIEVLERIAHTYRHDLESFFYVLMWVCVYHGWETGKRKDDPLQRWYAGRFEDIARTKRGDMTAGGFELHVLPYFVPECESGKGLARKLRSVLFSDGALHTGTKEKGAKKLYDKVLKAIREELASSA